MKENETEDNKEYMDEAVNKDQMEHKESNEEVYLAKKMLIQCELDHVLISARRKLMYEKSNQIYPRNWIYFRNKLKRTRSLLTREKSFENKK